MIVRPSEGEELMVETTGIGSICRIVLGPVAAFELLTLSAPDDGIGRRAALLPTGLTFSSSGCGWDLPLSDSMGFSLR